MDRNAPMRDTNRDTDDEIDVDRRRRRSRVEADMREKQKKGGNDVQTHYLDTNEAMATGDDDG